jgi:hypothetical protein
MNDRENGGRGTDAQRERDQRGDCEPGAPRKMPQPRPDVLAKGVKLHA